MSYNRNGLYQRLVKEDGIYYNLYPEKALSMQDPNNAWTYKTTVIEVERPKIANSFPPILENYRKKI